jgi:hypothetical protein
MRVSCGEYTFGYGFYFLYGVECVRVEIFDDPDHLLEIGSHTYADVDLETLTYLETYFDEQDAEMEKL